MKFLNSVFLIAFARLASAGGGYANNCKNMTLVSEDNGAGLRAYCSRGSYTPQCSILSLDQCYGSKDGVVVAQDKGAFSNWCPPRDCELNGTVLKSGCHVHMPRKGPLTWSDVDTNDLIVSDNGILRCFDHWGSTLPGCEERPVGSGTEGKYAPIALIGCLYILASSLLF
ncbi:hypothetical protein F4805DRAFT_442446 [Annulohypoxylon moriforme]|nr:hypothetical protein F4805DRAFT_442446 [Annulohypoxylon moriforme]